MSVRRTFIFVLGMLALLLVPFFAMQFGVAGWDWDARDFTIMSVILVLAGIGLATATCTMMSVPKRLFGLAAVGFLFLLYVHLAVGIVD